MSINLRRGTPGRLLILWAAMLPALVLFAWRIHLHRAEFEWLEYPTGLGDSRYYSALGPNDLYEPNLRFVGQPAGLFRRSLQPLNRLDERMLKVAREERGRCLVYTDSKQKAAAPKRVYLKSGEDQYVEFGQRKHWPEYQPPKALLAP